ncbi:methyltransferase family protein [Dyadobacter frigoris]|uniref:Isoprenylcysteine carboxylmethyltransferase family protein n=1 Tax=Dyadobacter frigoris TaxID=2576211 RepID=A0A4U6D6V3_9BACT|nr:isoprenylcysteine carboxylmethyltransferase family protein [Dyadobacter frigoris]TKT92185.1 isoprenylcysteine carboxylmethyltransferase family protein [Dyadobacter frigoris]GLU53351.1 protein-S-isoprenylcysteine methyltransferase [Dyadobacter frigoris]
MRKLKDMVFVGVQLVLFGLYAFMPSILIFSVNRFGEIAGGLLALTGLVIILTAVYQIRRSLTPFPSPVKNGQLITSGLYRYIRHPIYSGIILASAGYGLHTADTIKLIIALVLWLLFYLKSKYEERMLMAFYDDYSRYSSRTYRFFPFL